MDEQVKFRPEQVHPTAFIAKGAVVLGDVTLGEEASVWFNAVLHADEGFPTTLGEGVTVGHGAIVHGCTVEDNALIGMAGVVMNGAVVGRDSIVGVGAVVTEGAHIPPRSLVLGVPGKVIREVSEKDLQRIAHAAAHYVENAKRYMSAG